MNETQRAAAERLADDLQRFDGAERESLRDEAAALLRELLAEQWLTSAKLDACMASRDALRDWAQECRDQVLYLLAQRDDELGRLADGFGQASVALLRELLVEPQGEPVATLLEQSRQNCLRNFGPNGLADWIYTDLGELLADDAASMAILCKASEQVQRKTLTDKEIIALPAWDDYMGGCITLLDFARAVEKAHSITGEQE